MKTLLVFLAASVLFLTLGASNPPLNNPGRFELHQAKLTTVGIVEGNSSTITADTLFKLDTATGETWRWVSMQFGTKLIAGWSKCENIDNVRMDRSEFERESTKPIK